MKETNDCAFPEKPPCGNCTLCQLREARGALRQARDFIICALRHDVDIPGFDPATHVTVKRIDAALRVQTAPG